MFKTETHLHTSEASPCSAYEAAEMVRIYAEAGYKTIIVTDHIKEKYIENFPEKTWEAMINQFFVGYENAVKAGEKHGVNIILGAEYELNGCPNHYLTYGITPEIIRANPDICKCTPEEFYRIMKENGVLVVQAHPYRNGKCYPTPNAVDGFEIYNSSPYQTDYSEKSEATAKEFGLLVTSGSDAHRTEELTRSGMTSENEIKTAADFVELIRSGKGGLIR